ncbi:MAG: AAA family ATPase [Patescibacteria group bacterium]
MIVGHETNRDLLGKIIKGDKCHHSFLFFGPEKVGKFTIARSFARDIVEGSQAMTWTRDTKMDSDIHIVEPEVIEKKGRKIFRDISVDVITSATCSMALAPDKCAKVLIVNDAHRLTLTAQNALLKTLEEPRQNRYIILVTHDSSRLLDTIHSRCFEMMFGVVGDYDMKLMYETEKYMEDVFGRPGFLHDMHSDGIFRDTVSYAYTQLQNLAKKKTHERIELAKELSKKDDEYLQIFLDVWVWRIWAAAHKTQKFQLLKFADKVEDALTRMRTTNVNKQLILEDLLINIV